MMILKRPLFGNEKKVIKLKIRAAQAISKKDCVPCFFVQIQSWYAQRL